MHPKAISWIYSFELNIDSVSMDHMFAELGLGPKKKSIKEDGEGQAPIELLSKVNFPCKQTEFFKSRVDFSFNSAYCLTVSSRCPR